MALKDQWKETGKDMGEAFSGLGKNIIRTVADGVEKATDWAQPKDEKDDGSTVFNDGSWRETGKDFGEAFSGLGKSLLNTAKAGKDKAEDWAEDRKDKAEDKAEDVKEAVEDKAEDVKEAVEEKIEDLKD